MDIELFVLNPKMMLVVIPLPDFSHLINKYTLNV